MTANRLSTRRTERLLQPLNTKMGAIQSRAFETRRVSVLDAICGATSAPAATPLRWLKSSTARPNTSA